MSLPVLPEHVARAEFIAAVKPLLDLLNVEPNHVMFPIVIDAEGISLFVGAWPPKTPKNGQPQEFADNCWHCRVQVEG